MDLTFIIVNHHHSRDLPACIESIQNTAGNLRYEIRVVDNSLGDPGLSEVQAKFPGVHWTINPENTGFARACNQEAKQAQGRYLVFVNPDVVFFPNAILALWEHMESYPDTAVVGPRVLNPNGSLQYSCRRFPTIMTGLFNRYSLLTRLFPENSLSGDYLMKDFDHAHLKQVDWLSGCCMMVKSDRFHQAGMFDEFYFLFNEDVDLCHTLGKLGHAVMYCPEAEVTHRISSSNHKVPAKIIIERHKGMSHYQKKHMTNNIVTRIFLDMMIALRCGSQLLINLLR